MLSRKAFNEFRHRLDYREYCGAPLLGVRGICIIGHGSSNDRAIFNGVRVAYEFATAGTTERIEQEFAAHAKLAMVARGSSAAQSSGLPAAAPANPDATIQ